jgi:hypothetical protein
MLIEVKSIAFGMSRYSTRWHLDGATWTERRAAEAVNSEGKGRRRGRHRRGGIRRCGAPAHANPDPAQRMGGMSSVVIGWFCEHSPVVHELVAKFADMTRQGNGEGARVAAQRGYITPEAPTAYASGWPQGHGATSTKTKSRACPT